MTSRSVPFPGSCSRGLRVQYAPDVEGPLGRATERELDALGQIVGRVNQVRPVAEVMADLVGEFEESVARLDAIKG